MNNAALQALGFCVFNSSIAAELPGKRTGFPVGTGDVCVHTHVSGFFLCVCVSRSFNLTGYCSSVVLSLYLAVPGCYVKS